MITTGCCLQKLVNLYLNWSWTNIWNTTDFQLQAKKSRQSQADNVSRLPECSRNGDRNYARVRYFWWWINVVDVFRNIPEIDNSDSTDLCVDDELHVDEEVENNRENDLEVRCKMQDSENEAGTSAN